MNRCEEYVKKLPKAKRIRVEYAVRELIILLGPLEDCYNVNMMDLILSISTKKEQQECREPNKRKAR